MFAIMLCVSAAGAPVWCADRAFEAGAMGAAQIYPDDDFVFFRARAGGAHRTPYGLFAFNRATGEWTTIGTAENFSAPISWNGRNIDPETLFYSRSGYEHIQLGSNSYSIGWDKNRAVVTVTGIEPARYTSDQIPDSGEGTREYLFKHVQGARLWFDMRVKANGALYSEGIGCFDTSQKTFTIYTAAQLHFDPGRTIVTRMTGAGDRVILGVSFCDADTCLNRGGFIAAPRQGAPVLYTSDNALLPRGAVLDIVPDGDMFWIASAHGVTQWKPGMNTNAVYGFSDQARVFGAAPLRLWSGGAPAEGLEIPDNTAVTLLNATDAGFTAAVSYPIEAWTSGDHATPALNISGENLQLGGGNSISFYSAPVAGAQFLGNLQITAASATLKILQKQDQWVKVDLSRSLWFPPQNIVLYMIPTDVK